MTAVLDAAMSYAKLGWPVFPCKPGEKVPDWKCAPHGFHSASADPEQVKTWFTGKDYNVAISVGDAGLLVMDIDPRHGGDVALEVLISKYGRLPETLEVTTPQKGRHIYFKWSGKVPASIAEGVDLKSIGGYVMGPPSRTQHGTYEWDGLNVDLDKIAIPPDWLISLIQIQERKEQSEPIPEDKWPEGQRKHLLMRLLGKVRRHMNADELRAFAETVNKLRCSPPLEPEHIEDVLESHAKYRKNDSPKMRWFTVDDLKLTDQMPANMLVENILPGGACILASAAPKAGKSTFAVSLCHALATGGKFLGRLQAKPCKTLYWIPDDSNLARFARTWRDCAGDTDVPGFAVSTDGGQLPEAFELLEENITQQQARVCVVDSYTTIRGATSGDFVHREYDDLRQFSEIAQRTDCTVVLIHHHSKTASSSEDTFMSAAGSFAMSAACDAMWSFTRLESERKLSIRGRDIDDYTLIYRREENHKLRFLVDGDAAECWPALREAVQNGLTPYFDAAQLSDCLKGTRGGNSKRTAERTVKRWLFAGLVDRAGARYTIAADLLGPLSLNAATPQADKAPW